MGKIDIDQLLRITYEVLTPCIVSAFIYGYRDPTYRFPKINAPLPDADPQSLAWIWVSVGNRFVDENSRPKLMDAQCSMLFFFCF